MTKPNPVIVYTDGSCIKNPGPGGWSAVILADGEEMRFAGGDRNTTNNRMELLAAIQGLAEVCANPDWRERPVRLHIDSQYVKQGITEWITKWKKNNWRTADKKAVKNQDLWQTLDRLNAALAVSWEWVRGHDGDSYNELCDKLAREQAESRVFAGFEAIQEFLEKQSGGTA
jgi:ribonuclease HI